MASSVSCPSPSKHASPRSRPSATTPTFFTLVSTQLLISSKKARHSAKHYKPSLEKLTKQLRQQLSIRSQVLIAAMLFINLLVPIYWIYAPEARACLFWSVLGLMMLFGLYVTTGMSPLLLVAPLSTLTPLLYRLLFNPYFTPLQLSAEHTAFIHRAIHHPRGFLLWLHACQAVNELVIGVALTKVAQLVMVKKDASAIRLILSLPVTATALHPYCRPIVLEVRPLPEKPDVELASAAEKLEKERQHVAEQYGETGVYEWEKTRKTGEAKPSKPSEVAAEKKDEKDESKKEEEKLQQLTKDVGIKKEELSPTSPLPEERRPNELVKKERTQQAETQQQQRPAPTAELAKSTTPTSHAAPGRQQTDVERRAKEFEQQQQQQQQRQKK